MVATRPLGAEKLFPAADSDTSREALPGSRFRYKYGRNLLNPA